MLLVLFSPYIYIEHLIKYMLHIANEWKSHSSIDSVWYTFGERLAAYAYKCNKFIDYFIIWWFNSCDNTLDYVQFREYIYRFSASMHFHNFKLHHFINWNLITETFKWVRYQSKYYRIQMHTKPMKFSIEEHLS